MLGGNSVRGRTRLTWDELIFSATAISLIVASRRVSSIFRHLDA